MRFLLFLLLSVVASSAFAADPINFNLEGGDLTGKIMLLMALVTVLSIAPSILVMLTSFTRIVVVLSFLRSAIGLQQTPPNPVMISLALFLTFFIMSPVLTTSYNEGIAPLIAGKIDEKVAFEKSLSPFHSFMLRNTRQKDLELFINVAKAEIAKAEDTPYTILIPSFMISELRRAFEIGFLIFLPFLIIDMLISSILMSIGMMMLPPVMISLPFKLIFFVLIDGWHMVCGSLIKSFN